MPDYIISSASIDQLATNYTLYNAATITTNTQSITPQDVITADGDVENQTINSGTTIIISTQGIATGNTIQNGGTLYLFRTTGSNISNVIESGGIISADTAPMISTTIKSGGILNLSYTSALNTIINNGAVINMYTSAAIISQTFSAGSINVYNGATLSQLLLTSDVTMNVYGSATIDGITLSTGGIINFYENNIPSTSYYTGSIDVNGGILNIYSDPSIGFVSVTGTGIVNGSSPSGYPTLVVKNGGVVNLAAGSFSGNIGNKGIIKASNLAYDGSTASTSTTGFVSMTTGATLDIGYGVNVLFHNYSGGVINIQSGGYISSLIYEGYGDSTDSINIYSGGSLQGDNNIFNITLNIAYGGSADTVNFVESGHVTVDGSVNSINLGMFTVSGEPMPGATAVINSGGIVSSLTTYSNGMLTVNGSVNNVNLGVIVSGVLFPGGTVVINSGGVVGSLAAYSNANATFNAGASLTGALTLNDSAKVTITTSTGGTIDLIGDTNAGLTIYGSAAAGQNISVTTAINDFSGVDSGNSDSITLADISQNNITNVTFPDNDHITLTLSDNSSITLNIPNIKTTGYSLGTNDSNGLMLQVCFLTGTMIEIPGGVCAVEDLKIGDNVLVYDPVTQEKMSVPVTWIGHKTTFVKPNLHHDEAGYPVRILKDAITENVPNKDLLITAEHCLYFNGKFIPARMLVNGYSIYYDTSMTSYDYYHIETAEHSILTADGVLSESYLDTGNRHAFNLDHKIIELSGDKVKTWQNDAIAPLVTERSIVGRIYYHLLQRAYIHERSKQTQSFELTQNPDICLMTDQGEMIYQNASSTDKKLSFLIPNNVSAVWILSRSSRPCDVIGPFIDDRRYLGVLVGDVTLQRNGKKHPITTHLDADHLLGWDVKEASPCRWTKGKAFLPLTQLKCRSNKPNLLTLDILSDHSYILDLSEESNKKRA